MGKLPNQQTFISAIPVRNKEKRTTNRVHTPSFTPPISTCNTSHPLQEFFHSFNHPFILFSTQHKFLGPNRNIIHSLLVFSTLTFHNSFTTTCINSFLCLSYFIHALLSPFPHHTHLMHFAAGLRPSMTPCIYTHTLCPGFPHTTFLMPLLISIPFQSSTLLFHIILPFDYSLNLTHSFHYAYHFILNALHSL